MATEFLLGKKSMLKVEPTINYTKENKVRLSVDAEILKNKSLNKLDTSKDPNASKQSKS